MPIENKTAAVRFLEYIDRNGVSSSSLEHIFSVLDPKMTPFPNREGWFVLEFPDQSLLFMGSGVYRTVGMSYIVSQDSLEEAGAEYPIKMQPRLNLVVDNTEKETTAHGDNA